MMNKDVLYRVWLQCALGYSHNYIERLLKDYTAIEIFFKGGMREWKMSGLFDWQQLERMKDVPLSDAEMILQQCEQSNVSILVYGDKDFPERLKQIPKMPSVLYYRGVLPKIDDELCIAMVGTRNATPYGMKVADDISADLARAGCVVVSGGAIGIDTAAHKGTLRVGGRTLLVLGCGIEFKEYLPQNQGMREAICEKGALISEYPPMESPHNYYFPARNRIISGLSVGTVVVEAGNRSGSLITAELATIQGKDIFAIPGSIYNAKSNGTNLLIRDGATPVFCAKDILKEYAYRFPHISLKEKEIPVVTRVRDAVSEKKPMSVPKEEPKAQIPPYTEKKDYPSRLELSFPQLSLENFDGDFYKSSQISSPSKQAAVTKKEASAEHSVPTKKGMPSSKATAFDSSKKEKLPQIKASPVVPEFISQNGKKLFSVLTEQPIGADILAIQSGLSSSEVSAAATELEIVGLLKAYPGKRFGLK